MKHERSVPLHTYMQLALIALLVAASTGVLLRFGLFRGMPPWAQNLAAIRHAHSHLMYFGWATLAIMAMIWRLLPHWTQAPLPRGVRWQMGLTAFAAFLSYPAFWSNGYGLTEIGPVALPLGAMVSGVNGLMWLFFAVLYVRATAHLDQRPLPVQLWDWAIVLLLLAFCGALGLVVLVALDVSSIFLQQTMLHLFLELFATGWFTLALLGLLWAWLGRQQPLPRRLPTQSLALLLAPTFFLGVSPALVPPHIVWISVAANFGAALLLAWHLGALWQRRDHLPPLARFAVAALSLHLVIAFVLVWPGLWQWSAGTQLRIFYLHNLLLGWISSGLLGLAMAIWFPQAAHGLRLVRVAWAGGVALMLLALLGLGIQGVLAPVPVRFWWQLAAWSSVIVAGSISGIVAYVLLAKRHPAPQPAYGAPLQQRGDSSLVPH